MSVSVCPLLFTAFCQFRLTKYKITKYLQMLCSAVLSKAEMCHSMLHSASQTSNYQETESNTEDCSTYRPRSNKPEDWGTLQSRDNGHDGVQIIQFKKTLLKHSTIQVGMSTYQPQYQVHQLHQALTITTISFTYSVYCR